MLPKARALRHPTSKRNLSPPFIHPHQGWFVQQIEPVAAPKPVLRHVHKPTFHRIAMHIPQLLGPFLRRPYVEVLEARLPEGPSRFLGEQFTLPPVTTVSPRQQRPRRTLLHHLHHGRRTARFRFADQKMDVLRHDHIPHHHKPRAPARLFQDGKESVASPRRT